MTLRWAHSHFVGFVMSRLIWLLGLLVMDEDNGGVAFMSPPGFCNRLTHTAGSLIATQYSLNGADGKKWITLQFLGFNASNLRKRKANILIRSTIEPSRGIMALIVLRKLILQPFMRSRPVGLDV